MKGLIIVNLAYFGALSHNHCPTLLRLINNYKEPSYSLLSTKTTSEDNHHGPLLLLATSLKHVDITTYFSVFISSFLECMNHLPFLLMIEHTTRLWDATILMTYTNSSFILLERIQMTLVFLISFRNLHDRFEHTSDVPINRPRDDR